jgi:hypothetical protein
MTTPTAQRESNRDANRHRAGTSIPQHQGAEAVASGAPLLNLWLDARALVEALEAYMDAREARIDAERRNE